MKRIDYIRTLSVEEVAKKIRDVVELNDFCKSDCGESEDHEPEESECVKCCIKWLESEI